MGDLYNSLITFSHLCHYYMKLRINTDEKIFYNPIRSACCTPILVHSGS